MRSSTIRRLSAALLCAFVLLAAAAPQAEPAYALGDPISIDVHCSEVNVGDCDDLLLVDLQTDSLGAPSLVGYHWGGSPPDDIDAYCDEVNVGDCGQLASVSIFVNASTVPTLTGYTTK